MTNASICWSLIVASIKGQMQYRTNFLLEAAFGLFFQTVGFLFVWIVVGQFQALGGWSLDEITFLFGMRSMAHGMWLLLFSRLFSIDSQVRMGDYDRMLLRPIPAMLQLMFSSFRATIIGDVAGGVVLLWIGIAAVDIAWTPAKMAFLVAALIGGGLLDGAFQLGAASLTFRFLETFPLRILFDTFFSRYGNYPTSIFDRPARFALTWLVPVAFMAWVPASVLLDRTASLPFPAWLAWCSPLLGVVLVILAFKLFIGESRHYQSAGS
jgi:ABC-2 type transport system permease protein